MTMTTAEAAQQDFLPLMRNLVRAYQAFAACDAQGLRRRGLTVPQADVIFTLGNQNGLTCKEIGERTLITKGTLTGVIDRLEARGLVRRRQCPDDGRCLRVSLTSAGNRVFEDEFPRQIAWLKERFDRLPAAERDDAVRLLGRLVEVF